MISGDGRTDIDDDSGQCLEGPSEARRQIAAGEVLFLLEVMKTEVPHAAEAGGTVTALHVARGPGRRRGWHDRG